MDIQALMPRVLESIKNNRQVRPTVYAQFKESALVRDYPLMHFVGDSRAKASLLFALGRAQGRANIDKELEAICLVTEMWLTKDRPNPAPGFKPPAHIVQKEAVMFLVANAHEPYAQTAKIYEIKRGKDSKPQELVVFQENAQVEGLLGLAFVAGYRSRAMPDDRVRALMPQGMRVFL